MSVGIRSTDLAHSRSDDGGVCPERHVRGARGVVGLPIESDAELALYMSQHPTRVFCLAVAFYGSFGLTIRPITANTVVARLSARVTRGRYTKGES